ncbi:MAG: DUF354 domain-containing protein [candidate division KSB1 bacterium]|nr:DUF354 domain-containing protein [candidate division KSB1 bacterium]
MTFRLYDLRLLFDICHPAEVHHFRHLYRSLKKRGWTGLFAARDKDVTRQLLAAYDLPAVIWSEPGQSVLKKIAGIPRDLYEFYHIVRTFKPDVMLSTASLHSSWIGGLLNIPHIACLDTEHRVGLDRLTLPFVTVKLVSNSYQRRLGGRTLRYNGTHESAYLHPDRFQADLGVLKELGVKDQDYVMVRFVAWNAFHDHRGDGMTDRQRIDLVSLILNHKKVFVCAENDLPADLQPYRFPLPPHRFHHALAFAQSCISEGATTAAEAVWAGTPAVLLNPFELGYIQDAKHYGALVQKKAFTDTNPDFWENWLIRSKSGYRHAIQTYRRDHIDSTLFMERYLLSYE